MKKIRLFPIVLTLLFICFTMRIGDFFLELTRGNVVEIQPAAAFANDAEKKPVEKTEEKVKGKKDSEAPAERQDIPAKKAVDASEETTVKGLEKDPFASDYSDEEINVLQSLSKRREQLEQRERDLDQREKLLQAAEKKVDEKVAEMDSLKKQIEGLLQQQQKLQDDRIAQLVKIYENMKPKDAANIFNEMDFDVLLGIIDKMSERKVSPIMAAMDPARAREVSAKLAEQRALPKPAATN